MKILLTGATGYIGQRLLPVLVDAGYTVVCAVRNPFRFNPPKALQGSIEVVKVDFLDPSTLQNIPADIKGAYYLIHSMSASDQYQELELKCAVHFRRALRQTSVEHVVYLSGMVNEETLSEHLASRKAVEKELQKGDYHLTTLRAGIIIGSGSASFEIMRDLVEKLPIMIAPKWLKTRCQPISIRDVIELLHRTLFTKATYDNNYDIGGPDILNYREMLLEYARVRGLKRKIFMVPVLTPRLSSLWLYFITATSFKLAKALVDSMKVEVICRDRRINDILGVDPVPYKTALKRIFSAIEMHEIPSSWKDALISGQFDNNLSEFMKVPEHGCFIDYRTREVSDVERCKQKIWQIGGQNGWYYADVLWALRGIIDKLFGGVGLRRGRKHPTKINVGDAIDFWRVLWVDYDKGHLLLFAEMKLPGEAWLEFKIEEGQLYQTATFRPKGIWGRCYWYMVYPFHRIIFGGLLKALSKVDSE